MRRTTWKGMAAENPSLGVYKLLKPRLGLVLEGGSCRFLDPVSGYVRDDAAARFD